MVSMTAAGMIGAPLLRAQDAQVMNASSDPYHLPGVLPTFFAKDSTQGSPYLVPGWLRGIVELSSRRRLPETGKSLFFNYDKMNERLFVTDGLKKPWFYPRDSLNGFWLMDSAAEYDFERVPLISSSHLLRVLVKSDSGYSLYKRMITKLVSADFKNYVYWTDGRRADFFVDRGEYYLVYPGNKRYRKVELTVKDIKKALPNELARLGKFFGGDNGTVDEQTVVILVKYLNEQAHPPAQ